MPKSKKVEGSRLVRKGTKVTREIVVCEKCSNDFERAIVHPYIKTCKDCRGTSKKAKVKSRMFQHGCPECRSLLESGRMLSGTMYQCPFCEDNWTIIGNGWYRYVLKDEVRIFYKDTFIGLIENYGDFRRMVDEHPEFTRP